MESIHKTWHLRVYMRRERGREKDREEGKKEETEERGKGIEERKRER